MKRSMFATLALLCLSLQAQAAPITWTLVDAQFVDGGTATGYFVYDSGVLLDYDVQTSAAGSFSAFHYLPTTSQVRGLNFDKIELSNDLSNITRNLLLASGSLDLTTPGASLGIGGSEAIFENGAWIDRDWLQNGGHFEGVAGLVSNIPEPASTALFILGLAGLAGLLRKPRPLT